MELEWAKYTKKVKIYAIPHILTIQFRVGILCL